MWPYHENVIDYDYDNDLMLYRQTFNIWLVIKDLFPYDRQQNDIKSNNELLFLTVAVREETFPNKNELIKH